VLKKEITADQKAQMIPAWSKFETHLDANMRPISAVDHNPTTLYIPKNVEAKFTNL